MSDREFPTPELNVFLIASHVVYGYVGNKTASFVLQALGCNVSALNTVHFSNHTGYGSWTGTKQTGDEMWDVYWKGLVANGLADSFDMMLTGYCPGAEAVEAVRRIALDLKHRAAIRPGSFFWVLDPVMGDNGKLYVDPNVVPVYQSLVPHADLIVPNQFELETLAGLAPGAVDSFPALLAAITDLHARHRTAHVLVTSVRFAKRGQDGEDKPGEAKPGEGAGADGKAEDTLSVVGSTRTSDGHPRAFRVDVHAFDCSFSGTGDLLASLMAVRLREAAAEADLLKTQSWLSPDAVTDACRLPLAKATLKALASMHTILQKTMDGRKRIVDGLQPREEGDQPGVPLGGDEERMHKLKTKAAEVRIVRNVGDLLSPREGMFEAHALDSYTLPHNRANP